MIQDDDRQPLVGKNAASTRMISWMFIVSLALGGIFTLLVFVPEVKTSIEVKNTPFKILSPNPIIGIHAHESKFGDEFIASSYVKWIESAGGRAVRIPYNASEEHVRELLKSVNGLLFPGGSGNATEQAKYMYKLVLEMNSNGTYFPLWGTCLGFEWLVQLQSNNLTILDHVDARNLSSTLKIQRHGQSLGRMFDFNSIFSILETSPLSFNYHQWAILQDHFEATESLTSFFKPLATSTDRNGKIYVSAIEAIDFPIYGVQFHPEKNAYEQGRNKNGDPHYAIDHSYDAIMTSQAFAHFFIHEAKRNSHAFPSPEAERMALLDHMPPSNRSYPSYQDILIFKNEDK